MRANFVYCSIRAKNSLVEDLLGIVKDADKLVTTHCNSQAAIFMKRTLNIMEEPSVSMSKTYS